MEMAPRVCGSAPPARSCVSGSCSFRPLRLGPRFQQRFGAPQSSGLYTANTMGVGIGRSLRVSCSCPVSVRLDDAGRNGASALSATTALLVAASAPASASAIRPNKTVRVKRAGVAQLPGHRRLGVAILAVTGFARFLSRSHGELFAMVIGPSTYPSVPWSQSSSWRWQSAPSPGRLRQHARNDQSAAGNDPDRRPVCALWASSYAGTALPVRLVDDLPALSPSFLRALVTQSLIIASVVMPCVIALGVSYPLALGLAAGSHAGRVGSAYGVNAMSSVTGSLAAGWITDPFCWPRTHPSDRRRRANPLRDTLRRRGKCVTHPSRRHARGRCGGRNAGVRCPGLGPRLLAGGAYQVARRVPGDHNVSGPSSLRAGTLLYYQEGVTGKVFVKLLNGVTSLAIDGKVDASTSADMLTQKALAHLPLLLHGSPAALPSSDWAAASHSRRHSCIRSSGSTSSSVPEVVKAARYFVSVNRDALADAEPNSSLGTRVRTCCCRVRPTT